MRSFARVLIVATLLAVLLSTSAYAACGIQNCRSCILGRCTNCEDGYYVTISGACESCSSEHCARCQIAGRCTACEAGYSLTYIDASNGIEISSYGKCSSQVASESCGDNCNSCLAGRCLTCKNGYYINDGKCESCRSAHCTHCQLAGRCVACESGYSIGYIQINNSSVDFNAWGTCTSDGATFRNMGMAVVAAVSMLLYIL